jgi:hypothetical protein
VIAEEASLGGVLGVYVNRPNREYTMNHNVIDSIDRNPVRYYWLPVGGDGDNVPSSNIVDLFWGQSLGDADLGVHLNYGDNGIVTGNEAENFGVGIGLGFNAFGPFNQLNIHGDYAWLNQTDKGVSPAIHDNGVFTAKLGALASADVNADNSLRFSADLQMDQANTKDLDGWNYNQMSVVLGFACNHKVNAGKGLVSTGLLLDWTSGTWDNGTKENYNEWSLLWNGSVESEIISNVLTLRAGINKALVARGYDNTDSPTYFDQNRDNVSFNTGFGVNFGGNFTIDGTFNVSDLEDSLNALEPGSGVFFDGQFVTIERADVRYKF